MTDSKELSILITGASAGIGQATAEALVVRGHRLWLAGRSESKTAPVLAKLRQLRPGAQVEFLSVDLGDLASVRDASKRFANRGEALDVLLLNAGVAGFRGTTKDGFELAFGTNHLGHFLMTKLLLPALRKSAPSRVVVVASTAHYRAKALDLDAVRRSTASFTGWREYQVSKLANVLFARELAERVAADRIATASVHPGVVASELWRRIPWPVRSIFTSRMISNEEGAETSVFCATSPEIGDRSGLFWDKCTARRPSDLALDDGLAKRLWDESEEWVAPFCLISEQLANRRERLSARGDVVAVRG